MSLIKKFLNLKTMIIAAFALTVIFGTVFAFVKSGSKITYLTEPVKYGTVERAINATGETGALDLLSIGSQVSGQIEKLYVTLGQKVKKGDLIARIDCTAQQSELDLNRSKLESYKAQLISAEIALKTAESQYKREEKLYEAQAASKEDLENAENNYEAAKAAAADLKALIGQSEILIKTAEINLGYTTISAPRDGTIVSVPVKEGQTVNASQSTPVIAQIADLNKMEILIQISEADVTKIKPGMKVKYNILSEPDKIYETTLKSIDPGLTDLTNGTYGGIIGNESAVYYYARIIADNEEGGLYIGMSTQNEIIIESAKNALIVPVTAVKEKSGGKYVYVLENKMKKEKEVKTGVSDNINIQIIDGLSEGDKIIVSESSSKDEKGVSEFF